MSQNQGQEALKRIQSGLDIPSDNALAIQYLAERIEQLERKLLERGRQFVPPTDEEVTEYAKSIGFDLLGSTFTAFYEARGWQIGSNKMRSWKAAVRTWKARRVEEKKIKSHSASDTLPMY